MPDQWTCRVCRTVHCIPDFARDCEREHEVSEDAKSSTSLPR